LGQGFLPALEDQAALKVPGGSNGSNKSEPSAVEPQEAECHRNIEVIWLLRALEPDFKTIADFRRDNRAGFRSVFREFVLLCRRLDLFDRALLAVDGTHIKTVNNKDRNFTQNSLKKFIRVADQRLDDYLRQLDEGDAAEVGNGGARTKNLAEKIAVLREKRGRYEMILTKLERTGEAQISLTDPDSRAMAAHTQVGVGYNIQVAVDAKHKMIVEQAVTNQVVDMGLLTQTAEAGPRPSRCREHRYRVSRPENEAVLDRMPARPKARPEILD
jgi:hypothetical protein